MGTPTPREQTHLDCDPIALVRESGMNRYLTIPTTRACIGAPICPGIGIGDLTAFTRWPPHLTAADRVADALSAVMRLIDTNLLRRLAREGKRSDVPSSLQLAAV